MTPDAATLHGLSYAKAVCMGMPHVGCRYIGEGARSTVVLKGAPCACCGRPATNAHHEPPIGQGGAMRGWTLRTPRGLFVLRPALIALCGTGAKGCHGRRHAGLVRCRWVWTDEAAEAAWWSGELLSHGFAPHDARLLEFGRWEVEDVDPFKAR